MRYARYFSPEEIVRILLREPSIPRVIRLSGGQPDLVPEWTPWMMQALIQAGLDKSTYLWVDDNLSGYYAWEFLSDEEWDLLLGYPNFGRIGTIKGFDPASFHYNTSAPPEHFYRQLDVLARWINTGVDQYAYVVFTYPDTRGLQDKIERLLDALQRIHPRLPLRVFPQVVMPFSPTVSRLFPDRERALANQYLVLEVWNQALEQRLSTQSLSTML